MLNNEANDNIETHRFYIKKAFDLAKNSGIDIPVAALIVQNETIISKATNLKETNNDSTAHAEIIAIQNASKTLNRWRLNDCIIYVTLEPCPMCASAIIYSRISKVVFSAYDYLYGAFTSVGGISNILTFHKPEVIGGVEENLGRELLENYFINLRK